MRSQVKDIWVAGPEVFENDCAAGTYGGWRYDRWGLPALSRWGEVVHLCLACDVPVGPAPRSLPCIASTPAIATSEI
jgi:hypothetical protein